MFANEVQMAIFREIKARKWGLGASRVPTRYLKNSRVSIWSLSVVSDSLWPHGLCSSPGFSVHGIFQAGILVWVAVSSSRGYSWPRNRTQVSCIADRYSLPSEPPGKPKRSIQWMYIDNIIKNDLKSAFWISSCLTADCSQGKLFTGWCKPLWFK